jgi:signal transduction histidine kinase/CheY-like chemotaxis protein
MTAASSPSALLRGVQFATASLTLIVVLAGLGGHWLGRPELTQWLSSTTAMVPETMGCLLLLAVGLLANAMGTRRTRAVAATLGYLSAAFAALVLSQYLTGLDYGIDGIGLAKGLSARMSPNAAMACLLAGLALGCLNSGGGARLAAPLLAGGALALPLLAVLGYVLGLTPAYQWGGLRGMALPTAAALLCLTAGLWAAIRARRRQVDFVLPLVVMGVLLLTTAGLSTLAMSRSLATQQGWVWHTFQVRDVLYRLALQMEELDRIERTHYNTEDEQARTQFDHAEMELWEQVGELRTLVADNPRQAERARRLEPLLRNKMRQLRGLFAMGVAGQMSPEARRREMVESLANTKLASAVLDEMVEEEKGWLRERATSAEQLGRETAGMAWLAGVMAFLMLGAALATMLRVKRARDEAAEALHAANRKLGVANVQLEHDVEERRMLQAGLAEARDVAVEASRLKSEFLANMSHELRTPMNGIIGMSELLLQSNLEPEQREMCGVVTQSADALLEIINDILDFSKIEAGRMHVDHVAFNPRQVVEDCMVLLAPRAHQKGLELVCDCDPRLPEQLVGDGGRIRQVVMNLAGNAIKFTTKGEVIVRLALLTAKGAHVAMRVEVSDTGEGIPKEAQARLFQPFTQADASTTRRFGGTGLGLAISRQLVELMGGAINFESEEGCGSQFWFELELPIAAEQPLAEEESRDLEGRRILVVDDNENNRKVVAAQLAHRGVIVMGAATAEQARELLRVEDRFDAVLLDWHMPDCDGLTLARELRAQLPEPQPRLVLMSSAATHGGNEAAELFDAVLMKPVRRDQLQRCLLRLVTSQKPAATSTNGHGADSDAGKEIRLLLVDDNRSNQLVVRMQLLRLGCMVDLADNGEQALRTLGATHYDGVFLDCQMPVLDGYEVTQRIRAGAAPGVDPKIPIIALTANALPSDRLKCLMAGMDDFVTKPVRAEELRQALERCGLRGNGKT